MFVYATVTLDFKQEISSNCFTDRQHCAGGYTEVASQGTCVCGTEIITNYIAILIKLCKPINLENCKNVAHSGNASLLVSNICLHIFVLLTNSSPPLARPPVHLIKIDVSVQIYALLVTE